MEYIHAALLLHSAGKPIDETHITKVVSSTGEKADDMRVKALVAALSGVDIKAAIEKAATPVVAAAPAAGAPAGAQPEKKKEEESKKEEEAAEGLAGLFG